MAWIRVIAKSKAAFFQPAFVVDWTEIVGIVGTAEDAKEVDQASQSKPKRAQARPDYRPTN